MASGEVEYGLENQIEMLTETNCTGGKSELSRREGLIKAEHEAT